jgi:DNA-binding XRE family transcriptional regulator
MGPYNQQADLLNEQAQAVVLPGDKCHAHCHHRETCDRNDPICHRRRLSVGVARCCVYNKYITSVIITQVKYLLCEKYFLAMLTGRRCTHMHETFGERLARLRKAAGLAQGALATQAGIVQSLVSMLEHDLRDGLKIELATALTLARILGVSVEYLATGQETLGRPRRKTPAA